MAEKIETQVSGKPVHAIQTLTPFKKPILQITTESLNEFNYLEWAQSAKIYLKSKEKMGYVPRRNQMPKNQPIKPRM